MDNVNVNISEDEKQELIKADKKATTALVLSIISIAISFFTCGIASLILTLISMKTVKKFKGGKVTFSTHKKLSAAKVLNIIGLILSIVLMVLSVLMAVLLVVGLVLFGAAVVVSVIAYIVSAILAFIGAVATGILTIITSLLALIAPAIATGIEIAVIAFIDELIALILSEIEALAVILLII